MTQLSAPVKHTCLDQLFFWVENSSTRIDQRCCWSQARVTSTYNVSLLLSVRNVDTNIVGDRGLTFQHMVIAVGTQRNTWILSSTEMAHARYNQNLMHTLLEFFLNPVISSPAYIRLYSWVKRTSQILKFWVSKPDLWQGKTSLVVLILQQFWKDVVVFWTMIRSERGFSMKQPYCSPEASIELWGWFISFQKHPQGRYTVPVNNFAWPTTTDEPPLRLRSNFKM